MLSNYNNPFYRLQEAIQALAEQQNVQVHAVAVHWKDNSTFGAGATFRLDRIKVKLDAHETRDDPETGK